MINSTPDSQLLLHVPVVSFIGKPDCGKTTLLEKLLPKLTSKGYKVGVIKHHVHEFEMDKPGKDTWKLKQAGACVVALSSPTGLGIIRDTDYDTEIEELVHRYFFDMDIVFTEGYKQKPFPKIEIYRSSVHETPLERDNTWVAMVADKKTDDDLPHFQPGEIDPLAHFIEDRFIKQAGQAKTTLMVNGKNIPLNNFVEGFLRKSLHGMTSALKGCENAKEITIHISNEK